MRAFTTAAAAAMVSASALTAPTGAGAAVVERLVLKIGDEGLGGTRVDPYLDWIDAVGTINGAVAGATDLADATVDYRDGWIDTNWGDALSVRVGFYIDGVEQAWASFDPAGTTKTSFFQNAAVTGSSWSDFTSASHNFFSIAGDPQYDRHWFVNSTYGGCGNDSGHFVVLDGAAITCSWGTDHDAAGVDNRLLLFSAAGTLQNYTSGNIGYADVFAVTVTWDDGTTVPLPAPAALLLGGLGALGIARRRRS